MARLSIILTVIFLAVSACSFAAEEGRQFHRFRKSVPRSFVVKDESCGKFLHRFRSNVPRSLATETVEDEYAWKQLFDGKTLDGWSVPVFGGDGEVSVKDGNLVIGQGAMITGVKYEKVFPRINYEIRYEAQRTMGNDFFAALTFPVNDHCCTFINGGWGGGTIGLSCVDGMDASENETSSFFSFTDQKWYKFRVLVTGKQIHIWIDEPTKDGKRKESLVVELNLADKKISLRDETSAYQPLGICTWVCEGQIRNLEYRKLKPEEVDGKATK